MGTLYVVGIGPGAADLVTPRARSVLEAATVIVGYGLYVDLVRAWLPTGRFHESPIGDEAGRTELALRLATAHERVALLGSGDAGVYGLAGLAFELRAAIDWKGCRPPEIDIVPGVTAATAAAALLGAPLGHDFAAISLSDLLTPWDVIERRLEASAAADFVAALYNPASRARRWQMERAREIFLTYRPATTPVGIVTDASRRGEEVQISDLATLSLSTIGMLSLVIVGNKATVVVDGRMVTPRGYSIDGSATAP